MLLLRATYAALLLTCSEYAYAQLRECVMNVYESGDDSMTLSEIRDKCGTQTSEIEVDSIKTTAASSTTPGLISKRFNNESRTEFEPYVITPHRVNFYLPFYTTNSINQFAYQTYGGYEENLEDLESKFQISLKVPLNHKSLFIEGDGIYLGFTLQALWQVYSSNISKPFRETNYQPEIFYAAPLGWQPFQSNTGFILGFEHQSNGQAQHLSRSWNRIYGSFLLEKENFALSFRPWYRIEEEAKDFPLDPDGDDNPDINEYMGHFDLEMDYKWNELQIGFTGRRNFATHKGSTEFSLTFPLWGKLKGYAVMFNGYGDSLIDYNYSQTRFGLGLALNERL